MSTLLVVMVTSVDTFRQADGGIAATCRYYSVRFVSDSQSRINVSFRKTVLIPLGVELYKKKSN